MTLDGSAPLLRLTTDAAGSRRPAYSPDGTKIIYSKDGDLFVVSADGLGRAEKR